MEITNNTFKCCLCDKRIFNSYGHNPAPLDVTPAVCCDDCNEFVVIPARLVVLDVGHKLAEWLIENPKFKELEDFEIAHMFEVSEKLVKTVRTLI